MSRSIHTKLWDVITQLPTLNSTFAKHPLKSGHGRLITLHIRLKHMIHIHDLTSDKLCERGPIKKSTHLHEEMFMYHSSEHDDVIKWKHFLRYWPFVRGIHRSPVNSQHRSVRRSFDVFFDLPLIKPLSKQWLGWWFETLPRPLWRHCNGRYWFIIYVIRGLWLSMAGNTAESQFEVI